MRSNIYTALSLAALVLASSGCGGRPDGSGQVGECQSNADCPVSAPVCSSENTCVECTEDTQCECNEVCSENSCAPFGVVPELLGITDGTLPPAENAHGVWSGEPGTSTYRFNGLCSENSDCEGAFQLCNPLTRGCVSSAEFNTACTSSDDCDGELVCEETTGLCLPAALCRTTENCCGVANVSCQATSTPSVSLCLAIGDECTPPEPGELTNECPATPIIQNECLQGEFCNANGLCVQCGCDADCASDFPVCDVSEGRCVGCLGAGDCDSGETCDPLTSTCQQACASSNECPSNEFCEPTLGVCRAQSTECVADENEPNGTVQEAVDGSFALSVPSVGQSSTVEDLGLCTGDDADVFSFALERGDTLQIAGLSRSPLDATTRVVGPDQVTVIANGTISPAGNGPIDLVANFTGDYYLIVERVESAGIYSLNLTRGSAEPGELCVDSFEDSNGRNDTLETAAILNNDSAPLDGCTVNGALGGSQNVSCLGNPHVICVGEADYFEIEAPAGSTVNATVSGSSGDLNAILYGPFVGDETLTTDRIASSSSSVGTSEEVEDQSRTGGRYILQVFRLFGDDPTYSLNLSIVAGEACEDDRFDLPESGGTYDPSSFNDVFTNATGIALTPDGAGEATLSVSDLNMCRFDVDWFRIGLEAGAAEPAPIPADQEIIISIDSVVPGPDSNVIVLGGSDPLALEPLVADEDLEGPGQSFSARPTVSGPYYVAVREQLVGLGPFDYVLNVSLNNAPACTPDTTDDDPANATVLTGAEGLQTGLSLCIEDVAYYTVPLAADERLVAQLFYDESQSRLAARGFDQGAVGSPGLPIPSTAQRDDSQLDATGFQWLDYDLDGQAGDAIVVVYNRDRWVSDYALDITIAPAQCSPDAFDSAPMPNDTFENAALIGLDRDPENIRREDAFVGPLSVCTVAQGGRDWFEVDLSPGDRFTGTFYSNPDEGQLEFNLRIPQPAGAAAGGIVASTQSPDSGDQFVGTIDYVVPPNGEIGKYMISVEPLDPSGNNQFDSLYFMDLSVLRSCAEDLREPSSQDMQNSLFDDFDSQLPFEEDLALCRDEDWYTFDVPGNRTFTACIDFVHEDGDIDLFLYDALTPVGPDELPVSLVAQSRQNISPEVITVTAPAGGQTYYLRAALDGNEEEGNTTYRLRVVEGSSCP